MPSAYTVYDIKGTSNLEVYRVTTTDDRDSPEFMECFMSNFALDRPPRKLEVGSAIIHMGISCWRSYNAAAGLARIFPQIGSYVARVTLAGGNGFNVALTGRAEGSEGRSQHLTVWGDPVKLAASVDEISSI